MFNWLLSLHPASPASENDLQTKRLKLVYEEITPCLKDVTQVWEKMLGTVGRAKIKFDMEKIHAAVGQGEDHAVEKFSSGSWYEITCWMPFTSDT